MAETEDKTPEWAEMLGIGALGQVRNLPSLVTRVATRRKGKKLKRTAEREQARQRQVALRDIEEQEGETARQFDRAEEARASDVAEQTGYSPSSYAEYSKQQLTDEQRRRMDALQRARANMMAGWTADDTMRRLQESIATVQRKAAIAEAILNQGMSALAMGL